MDKNDLRYLEALSYQYPSIAKASTEIINLTSQNLVAATVFLSIIPIVLVYPLAPKFLVKGITIGSVKG